MLKKRREMVGRVVSDKMDKTVVVEVTDRVMEPRYKKYLKRVRKMKAHDEKNECHVGDRVKMIETRPLSATKNWVVLEVVEKAI
jgi:small subunit ribosomal protein S17